MMNNRVHMEKALKNIECEIEQHHRYQKRLRDEEEGKHKRVLPEVKDRLMKVSEYDGVQLYVESNPESPVRPDSA